MWLFDSTDIPAYANGQKYRYRGGPERTSWSDPDASWGHRSAVSTRKGGGFYGYKLHLVVCTRTDLPLGWEVRTGKEADMRIVEPLLKQLAERGVKPVSVAMDKGYDYRAVYQACEAHGVLAVVAARKNSGTGERANRQGQQHLQTAVPGEIGGRAGVRPAETPPGPGAATGETTEAGTATRRPLPTHKTRPRRSKQPALNSAETPGTHHAHSPPVESDLCSLRAPMGLSFGVGISSPVVSAVGTMQGWAGSSMPINAVHPAANLPEWGVRSVALLTPVHANIGC